MAGTHQPQEPTGRWQDAARSGAGPTSGQPPGDQTPGDQTPRDQAPGGHGHGHGDHGHGDMPASPQVKKILRWVMIPLVAATVVALVLMWPDRPEQLTDEAEGGTYFDGTVTEVREQECPPNEQQAGIQRCGEVTVRVEEGPDAGSEITTRLPVGPGAPQVSPGDRVELHAGFDPADPSVARYDIADHQRGFPLLVMVALFAVAIVAFGRWRGLGSLAGLAACFGLLITFVLPAIIGGSPPLLVAVIGAATVMFVIMYLVHGVSVRTSVAVLGTLAAVLITGLLGFLGASVVHLTGFLGSSEELTLFGLYPGLDLRGVLLAGIIIGSLGVLDDVTVSQAATVGEIARANPRMSWRQLYHAGARVGRAHVASVVNTLVLAYAGASLPLLLLVVASGINTGDAVTAQPLAQEIVRSVVATIGLVAAVPITTGLAALVCGSARSAAPAPAGERPPPERRPARHRLADPPIAPGEALAPGTGEVATWPTDQDPPPRRRSP